jgi:hypothetical protein
MARSMWDASSPPAVPPAGFDAAAGYLGGDTPHIWTVDEWRRLDRLPKLPIWVRSDPGTPAQGESDALIALHRLYQIGAPRGITVALDLEEAVDPPFTERFGSVMHWAGFYVWPYGSRDFIFRNPPLDGYWVADFTGTPHFAAGANVRATQWEAGPVLDRSVVKWWSWRRRLWR